MGYLSVVSALTRLGVDPREEAAHLTPLAKARAAETLVKLPIRRMESLDDLTISRRLVELSPPDKPAPSQAASRQGQGRRSIEGP